MSEAMGARMCMDFLELLIRTYRVTSRLSRILLDGATREQVLCITEVIVNTMEGNLNLPSDTLRELGRGKRVLRKVSRLVLGKASKFRPTTRISATVRSQLKRVYLTHYKTLVEFLELCVPRVKKLQSLEDKREDGSDAEI